MARQFRG